MKSLLAVIVAIGAATQAMAWGDRGHRAIADIAWTQMSPTARREVSSLLAAAPALQTPLCPVGSLEDAATWADCVRSRYHDRYAVTATWHYVDVSVCSAFALPQDPDARFVVERYRRELRILADRRRPSVERLEALLWVVHLSGDLHQPLHVGDAGDRGGNEVTIEGGQGRYPLNLHAEWDRNLVDDVLQNEPGGVAGLAAAASDLAGSRSVHSEDPAVWARESWAVARAVAYPRGTPGPICNDAGAVIDLDVGYRRAAEAAVAVQLEKAGTRLADAINSATSV